MTTFKITSADSKDLPWIIKNAELCALKTFATANPREIFEMSAWSLVLKENEDIQACIAFQDYPNMAYNPTDWESQLRRAIDKCPLNSLNTLFLRTFICESKGEEYLKVLLIHTFNSMPWLVYCCLLTQEKEEVNKSLLSSFQFFGTPKKGFRLWCSHKYYSIPRIGIRYKKSNDYIALKNIFSQMFTIQPNDTIQNFTLDFLDYGEDKLPTYKYFTFDEGNTYIAVADTEEGEAVGFVYATTTRLDLDALNLNFQLEMVYGLRKVHPKDNPDILFSSGAMKVEVLSLEEEEAVLGAINDVIDVVDVLLDTNSCVEDLLDDVLELAEKGDVEGTSLWLSGLLDKTVDVVENDLEIDDFAGGQETIEEDDGYAEMVGVPRDLSLFQTESELDISNGDQSPPMVDKNITPEGLVRYINSPSFNASNRKHMELVPLLKHKITDIHQDRLEEILHSNSFDPSIEAFAEVSLYVMEKMPPTKLGKFVKSSIGSELNDKIKAKRSTKKERPGAKLSYMDKQAILREASEAARRKKLDNMKRKLSESSSTNLLTHINYRNMGFISGLVTRKSFENKTTKPSGKIESYEKYTFPKFNSDINTMVNIPDYYGANNCLVVEHLAIQKDHESHCLLLIMAALKYFPKVDFAVLLLPYGTKQVPMLRKYFTPIPARPFTFYEKELYVLHRYSFNESLKVRRYQMKDFSGVWNLIRCSCLSQKLINDLTSRVTGGDPTTMAVVMVSEDNVLGIAVITVAQEVGDIRKYYDIADQVNMKYHKYSNQGQLLHCMLHPSARGLSSMFMKEAMRLSQKSILYYKIYNSFYVTKDPSYWQSICNVIDHLLPLRLIRKQQLSKRVIRLLEDKSEISATLKKINFNLCYATFKTILCPKPHNSARIVIIGQTDTAFGVMESLIYNPYYRFTNVVAFSGSSMVFKTNEVCQKFEITKSEYDRDLLESLCLPAWVTEVTGSVVRIDSNVLHFKASNNKKDDQRFQLGYEYLVICEELKFQIQNKRPAEAKTDRRYSLLKKLDKYVYEVEDAPQNLFTGNSPEDGARAINWIWKHLKRKEETRARKLRRQQKEGTNEEDVEETELENIVVVGNCIEAYVSLAVLMEETFPNVRFTLVKAPKRGRPKTFATPELEGAVDHIARKANVRVLRGTMTYETELNEVHQVNIKDNKGNVDCLPCTALFVFYEKNIQYETFKALRESNLALSLPLEGGFGYPYLHVNANFQTSAENVFAVGSLTEMYTEGKRGGFRIEESCYNLREAGLAIGENIRKKVSNELAPPEEGGYPKLKLPSVEEANMPNSYIYVNIRAPSSQFQECVEKTLDTDDMLLPRTMVLGNLKTGESIVPSTDVLLAALEEDLDIGKYELEGEDESEKDQKESEDKGESEEGQKESEGKSESEGQQESEGVGESKEGQQESEGVGESKEGQQESGVSESKEGQQESEVKGESEEGQHKSEGESDKSKHEPPPDAEEEAPVEKQYPDVPDFLAFTFSTTERVESIECLTSKEVDIDSLLSLYDLPLNQFYKILHLMKQSSKEMLFRAAGNWVLPLDHFTLWDNKSIVEKNRGGVVPPPNCAFEGLYRPEYPEELDVRINGFLGSFMKDRSAK